MYKTLLALLFSGISLLLHADDSYVIQAHIRNVKDGTVFFLKQFSTQRIINAMRLENGKLQMKGELFDTPQHLWLCTTIKEDFYYCDLLVDTGTIVIEGCIRDFPNGLHFEGAETQMQYAAYLNETQIVRQKLDSLNQISTKLHTLHLSVAKPDYIPRQNHSFHSNGLNGLREIHAQLLHKNYQKRHCRLHRFQLLLLVNKLSQKEGSDGASQPHSSLK